MATDIPRRALSRWPANCSVVARGRTASGAFVEAACRSGGGNTLTIRRDLAEGSDRDYTIVTTSRIDRAGSAPQILPTASLRMHYVGPCPGSRDRTGEGKVSENIRAWTPGATIVWIVQFLAFIGFIYASVRGGHRVIRRLARSRPEHAAVASIMTDRTGAAHIPVLATFSGVRGLPWWYAVATNNARPALVVTPGGLDFRVVRRHQRSWDEIECVDVREAPGTVNLDITFRGALLTFGANLGEVPLVFHVLSLIPASVPLSDRAMAVKMMSGTVQADTAVSPSGSTGL